MDTGVVKVKEGYKFQARGHRSIETYPSREEAYQTLMTVAGHFLDSRKGTQCLTCENTSASL